MYKVPPVMRFLSAEDLERCRLAVQHEQLSTFAIVWLASTMWTTAAFCEEILTMLFPLSLQAALSSARTLSGRACRHDTVSTAC
jgi:hypothetical protein